MVLHDGVFPYVVHCVLLAKGKESNTKLRIEKRVSGLEGKNKRENKLSGKEKTNGSKSNENPKTTKENTILTVKEVPQGSKIAKARNVSVHTIPSTDTASTSFTSFTSTFVGAAHHLSLALHT